MRFTRKRWIAAALVAIALSRPFALFADEKADLDAARAAFREGSTFAEQKQWSAACDKYALSLKLHPAALTLYSLGVAQREAGRLVAASASFRAFLGAPMTAKTRTYVEPARAAVTELQGRVATLVLVLIPAPVPGVVVTIDGILVPSSSISERRTLDPGAHEIIASAPDRVEKTARVTLPEGGSATISLTLPFVPTADEALSGPLSAPVATHGTPKMHSPWPTALPFVLVGAGAAVFAGGLTLGIVGLADAGAARSAQGGAADDARAKGIAGDVLAGTGIAAASVGIVLLLVERGRTKAPTATGHSRISGSGGGLIVTF